MSSAKSKKTLGLGKSLIRNRFQTNVDKGLRMKVNPDGSSVKHTTETDETTKNWIKMQSITQENDLDAFLTTATLAGTEFTAEKLNIEVLSKDHTNPFLLTHDEEEETLKLHKQHKSLLTVPRRPVWDGVATPEVQQYRERENFLDWRRGLVALEEEKGLLMTPYERNLEVWRQLWRVLERSDLIVQIVDARHPTLFRSNDLESYVREVDPRKGNLLLVNKADMLTVRQREAWASYFEKEGVEYVFFSAALARRRLEEEAEAELAEAARIEKEIREKQVREEIRKMGIGASSSLGEGRSGKKKGGAGDAWRKGGSMEQEPERIRILSCDELLDLFTVKCPAPLREGEKKVTIGFVGYPNVGKSSTLNALVGAKKVTVSSTPGKTKHFQTIHLDESTVLCDCPGLVFPSFATTKAEMVVNGVLPIDQLREHTGPATLVAQRIPRHALSSIYGIRIRTFDNEGNLDPTAPVKGEQLCAAYAVNRGFKKSGQGNPDEARAARIILKDYVLGKLLFCQPPPGNYDPADFNIETYSGAEFFPKKKNA
ncbi:P-loop containing nucleoside triphosphate hydrolase protein, partial [Obelidium mucronatum]